MLQFFQSLSPTLPQALEKHCGVVDWRASRCDEDGRAPIPSDIAMEEFEAQIVDVRLLATVDAWVPVPSTVDRLDLLLVPVLV
jgi:hypothetical protein